MTNRHLYYWSFEINYVNLGNYKREEEKKRRREEEKKRELAATCYLLLATS